MLQKFLRGNWEISSGDWHLGKPNLARTFQWFYAPLP